MVQIPKHDITQSIVTGMLLAFVGGYLDSYTYICRGGVLSNAQTGNIVRMGAGLALGDFKLARLSAVSICAFILGTLLSEHLKCRCFKKARFEWQHFVVAIEAAILFLVGFIPTEVSDFAVNVVISFVAAVQVNSFRTLIDVPFATTMSTGNLRSAVTLLYQGSINKNVAAIEKGFRFVKIIVCFTSGAACGALLTQLWMESSVWVCCVILCIVLLMFLWYDLSHHN